MFCTNCGRKLPEDGTPCICGSGQREIAAAPVIVPQEETVQVEEQVMETTESFPVFEPIAEAEPEVVPQWEEPAAAEPAAYAEPVQGTVPMQQMPYTQPAPYVQPPVQQNTYSPYPQPNPYMQPQYAPPAYAVPQQGNAVQAAIRTIAASPLFMIAVIVMSVHFVLSIVQSFVPVDFAGIIYSVVPLLDSLAPGMGNELMSELDSVLAELYAAQAGIGLLSLPSMITPSLTVAALWITFITAKKKAVPSTGGLTILQVLQILALIGAGLGILGVLILGVFVVILITALVQELSYYGGMSGGEDIAGVITVVLAVLIIVALAASVLGLLFNIKVLTSVINAKKALKTGVAAKPASMYVAVYCFVMGGITVLDAFGSIGLFGWVSGLVNLCSGAASILFALCILQYNKAVKPLISGNTPVQPTQQPTYPPYNNY